METIQPDSTLPTVDLIVPFYNKEEALPTFHRRICAVIDPLPYLFHFIYVNDGSSDQNQARLNNLCQADPRHHRTGIEPKFWSSGCADRWTGSLAGGYCHHSGWRR
ncbi:MAG: glycosyltransferase [Anaerolineaceae bacterium]